MKDATKLAAMMFLGTVVAYFAGFTVARVWSAWAVPIVTLALAVAFGYVGWRWATRGER